MGDEKKEYMLKIKKGKNVKKGKKFNFIKNIT